MTIGTHEIYQAIKPHFIFDKTATKPLQVIKEFNESVGIAVVTFVGIAALYGVDEDDVKCFCAIEHEEYRNKLSRFRAYIAECVGKEAAGVKLDPYDVATRHYYKYRMCRRFIELNYKPKEMLSITDIFNIN
jgi:hypothetical protein